jgi:hypothetical protein
MTPEKVLEALDACERTLEHHAPHKFPHGKMLPARDEALAHCKAMIPQMRKFVAEGQMEKAFRWLGFVQCALWMGGIHSIETLKAMNRPDPA